MVLFYAVIVGKIAWAIKDLIYPKVCVLYYVRSVEKIYFRCDPLALFSNRCDYYLLLVRVLAYATGWMGLLPSRTISLRERGYYNAHKDTGRADYRILLSGWI